MGRKKGSKNKKNNYHKTNYKKKLAAKIKTAYAKNRRPKLTAREQAIIRKHWEKTTGLRR